MHGREHGNKLSKILLKRNWGYDYQEFFQGNDPEDKMNEGENRYNFCLPVPSENERQK